MVNSHYLSEQGMVIQKTEKKNYNSSECVYFIFSHPGFTMELYKRENDQHDLQCYTMPFTQPYFKNKLMNQKHTDIVKS